MSTTTVSDDTGDGSKESPWGTIAKAISAVVKIGSDPTLDFVSGCGGVEKAVEVLNTLEAEMNF